MRTNGEKVAAQVRKEANHWSKKKRKELQKLGMLIINGSKSSAIGTEREVCDDIATRQAKGIIKYGTTVSDNPLDLKEWLQHAYEECLDQAVYLKRAISELEKISKNLK